MFPTEPPYQGRATWQNTGAGVEIRIPARRGALRLAVAVIFLLFSFSNVSAAVGWLRSSVPAGRLWRVAQLGWGVAWALGGWQALRHLGWWWRGQEVITIGQGTLTLAMPGLLLHRPKTYDLQAISDLQVYNYEPEERSFLGAHADGDLRFAYHAKTVRFAYDVGAAEALALLAQLRRRRLLPARSFAQSPAA